MKDLHRVRKNLYYTRRKVLLGMPELTAEAHEDLDKMNATTCKYKILLVYDNSNNL